MSIYPLYIENVKGLHPRSIGDLIENRFVEYYTALGGLPPTGRKSIEDFCYRGVLYDVKTVFAESKLGHGKGQRNLISIPRSLSIRDLDFKIVECVYSIRSDTAVVTSIREAFLHEIPWDNLGFQNIGRGQITIRGGLGEGRFQGCKDDWYQELYARARKYYVEQFSVIKKYLKDFDEKVEVVKCNHEYYQSHLELDCAPFQA